MDEDPLDCLLVPCGVSHSIGGSPDLAEGSSFGCGFASPPQLDLYLTTPFFDAGTFAAPPWSTLSGEPKIRDPTR